MVIPEVVIIAAYFSLILLLAFPQPTKRKPPEKELEDAIAKYLSNLEKTSKDN
jgi:hypothetical protein